MMFVTMEELKKNKNQYVPPNSCAQVCEDSSPAFFLHICNNKVSNIQIPYIWLANCMEYCM